ncbi:hypothetical protein AB1Y20_005615 [Prymnesium parvum]|uniref:Uncharacterized protein n=1 Tax=Prymnesium parvum TaxID=97485 RepID=A0AB34J695_PRYPA
MRPCRPRLLLFAWLTVRVAGQCSRDDIVSIDFSSTSNPSVALEWTNAAGQLFTGERIPFGATDADSGAFPGGSLRWKNVGYHNVDNEFFDLLVTVSDPPSYYSDTVNVQYWSPRSSAATQALFTSFGFACLGFGVRPSTCASGANVQLATATCSDGSTPIMRAAEFDFRFVQAGTTTAMAPFGTMHTTFYDVDGDVVNGGLVFEFVSVLGATTRWIDATSTLQPSVFSQSGALYAISTQSVNVPTDFNVNPATPSDASLPAISYFELQDLTEFKVLLGGRSSIPNQNDRGYCFSMILPEDRSVLIDFSSESNPGVAMEWTDATGTVSTGERIPFGATDTTGGAFPGGSLRWKNVGYQYSNGEIFDLLVTVSDPPSYYSDTVNVQYWSPQSSAATQALFTSFGFACLGFGVRPSTCASGANVQLATATCSDGSTPIMRAAEFDFRFVQAGTTTAMTPFGTMYTTFYDVDGDVVNGGLVFEFVSVLGATTRWIDATSTLQAGVFSASGALYAISTQSVNVPTDFNVNPATPSDASLPAISYFELQDLTEFKVLLGGRSSIPNQNDRGYCFSMVLPEWTDATGTVSTGERIPFGATDTTGGAFPGGSLRWKNVGYQYSNGEIFDLLVTVSDPPSYYSDTVNVQYWSPQSSAATQALFTSFGFACLGFGVRPSTCASGANVQLATATCSDGSTPIMRAAEFDFRFVQAGTTTAMAPFGTMHTTFYDVDGDVVNGGIAYEFVSVLGALSQWTGPSSTLQEGVFSASGALYAISTQSVNVPTNFNVNPATPSDASLPAISYFELQGVSEFKVLLGGRSSIPDQNDRGYCFSMVLPEPTATISSTTFASSYTAAPVAPSTVATSIATTSFTATSVATT